MRDGSTASMPGIFTRQTLINFGLDHNESNIVGSRPIELYHLGTLFSALQYLSMKIIYLITFLFCSAIYSTNMIYLRQPINEYFIYAA